MRGPRLGFIDVQRESSFVNLTQSRINEGVSLREELSRSGWAHPWGVVLTVRIDVGRPTPLWVAPFLDLGPGLCQGEESEQRGGHVFISLCY